MESSKDFTKDMIELRNNMEAYLREKLQLIRKLIIENDIQRTQAKDNWICNQDSMNDKIKVRLD